MTKYILSFDKPHLDKLSDPHLYFLTGAYKSELKTQCYPNKFILTRNTAIDIPTRKPAITSDQ